MVGAGVSGLTAALLLSEAGLKVTVLEAANQPGGRIRSLLNPETRGYLADLGPTWVWPEYQPIAARWLARLGLKTFAQYEIGDAVIQMSMDQPVMRRPVPGQHGIRRIVGGTGAIVDRMVSALPKGSIRTAAPASRISMQERSVEIAIAGGTPGILRSRYVVVAIPLRVAANSIDWAPALDGNLLEQMASFPTWMASQAKAIVVFDRAIWRDEGLLGRIASQVGPLVEAHDHSRHDEAAHAIFGFIGWPAHIRKEHGRDLEGRISEQIAHCFGSHAPGIRQIHIEDWADNFLVCTPLDLRGRQNHPEVISNVFRHLHADGRLAFAVAEVSAQSPGLIEGAFDSGEIASGNVLQSVRTNTRLRV